VTSVERIEPFHRQTGNPAAPTPATDGERLYVFFGSYGLICYDLAGQKIWEQRLGPFQDEFGSGSSPVVVGDAVVLCRDHDLGSFLLALDRRTGRTLWTVDRPDAVRSYSTPAVWTRGGQKELLVAGALELAAYAPDSGEKLWWVKGLARIVVPAPVPQTI
jgi:outer membrane protein assembly factor BamB